MHVPEMSECLMGEAQERHGWHIWHWLSLALVIYIFGFVMLVFDATRASALSSMGPSFWSAIETIYAPLIYLVEHL